jgi:amino acid adenylation domain-containing protein
MGEALSDLSRREGASLFMTMLAGFAILLLRYTGQEDLSIGTFHANRNRREIEGLIGYFLNILVLRADLSGQPTVREVIQRVRQVCLEAYEHQDLPFEKILEAIQPERERGFAPLFQVMVVMINLPDRTLHLPDLDVQVVPGGGKRSNVDLTLWLYEGSQGLTTSLEYNVDLFEERTIKRILMHYQMVLSAMVADPDQSIRAFPILSSQEYNALLQIGNGTKTSFVSELSNLVALFEAQVTRTPQAIAVIDEQEQLTYQQLNQRANQLAHILRRRGITSETCVGVCLERSCHLVAAILAILKAGGAYLPIDPGTPTERILFMLADARAPLLICQSSLAKRIPDSRPATLCLDDKGWPASFAEEDAENLSLTLRAGQAAYIIYTSGSTGLPKGVVGLHQGMVNRLHWMWQAYPFSANEVCCQKTSLNFVDSIAELFSPLLQGVPTVLFSSAESTDPVQLVEALARWRVSRLVLVPSLLRTLLDTFPDLATRLPSLHLWVSSGESLPLSLWQRFQETLPHRRLLNLYGSSEVSADSTFYEAKAELEQWNSIPIGRPVANTRIYLLDPSGQPVPVGVPGEIYIGGIGLNRGYLNRPDATAERFVPDSLSDEAGARLYRTGDRAVYREGGILEFLGRSDHQIKVRGVRIELGEIEKVLSLVSGVQACAVTAGALEEGDISLIAYVVAQAGQPLSSKFLRRALREQLPSSMIPGYFIFLEHLPLSSNGKLNRDALPEPVLELLDRSEEYVAPRTPVEEVLADIWADVLHVSRAGIYDNFFDLGGHSLSATQVITQIRQRFHVDLPVRSLFETTTLADLALLIVQEQMNQVGDEALMQLLAEVTQLSTDEIQALLPAQQRVREGAHSDE